MHERTSSRGRTATLGTIALSLGLTMVAGQLAVPSAAAAAPAIVTAAAASAVKPKVTTSVNRSTIAWGSKVTTTVRLRDPRTGKAVAYGNVKLQAKRNGTWKTWLQKKVSTDGRATFTATPMVTGQFRFYYTGTRSYRAVVSSAFTVKVVASGQKVVSEAGKHKGALYKYAASGPSRFDCSGFTMYVYKKAAGRKLPHKANSQQKYGSKVAKGKQRVGDLIIFRSGSYGYHAGVYAGNGMMWDSPHSGARVSKRKMISSNYVVRRLAAV